MKKLKYTIIALLSLLAISACNDEIKDPTLNPGEGPEFSDLVLPETVHYGDSLVYQVTLNDNKPLSTLTAQIYFGQDEISKTVVRTKSNGTYSGKVLVPYFKDIPDGTLTFKLTAQNIEFGTTVQENEISVERADYEYLTLVSEDGREYRMDRTDQYQYIYHGILPQRVNAYIVSPEPSEEELALGVNQITWGKNGDEITSGVTNSINFINTLAGEYDITFNSKTYEAAPFESPISMGGIGLQAVNNTLYKVELNIEKGQILSAEGFTYDDFWIDPDFFEYNNTSNITFLAISGKYRILIDKDLKYITAEAMNGDELSTFADGGSVWLIGWGIGKPNPSLNNINWSTDKGLCMAKIDDNLYQITLTFLEGYDFKFFYQKGWGGEFGADSYSSTPSNLLFDGGNFKASTTNPLDLTKEYILTLNTAGGDGNAVLEIEEKSSTGDDTDALKFDGMKMTKINTTDYRIETNIDQDHEISVTGINLDDVFVDSDYFEKIDSNTLKFLPMSGKYRITYEPNIKFLRVEAMNGDELSTYADGGSLWLIGYGVGKPDAESNNINWDTNQGLCMAKIAENVFQITTKLLPVSEENKFDFKFFHQKGWGGELGGAAYSSYQNDLVSSTDSGNFQPLDGINYSESSFYRITVDITGGLDSVVMTMEEL